MSKEILYTVPQLSKELSITERTIRFYESKGLITPSRAGNTRVFNYKDYNKLVASDNNKSFGSVSGREFQALAINLYLSAFNNATGEVTESEYIDEDCKTKKYVTSLNNLTVISESNTADVPEIFKVPSSISISMSSFLKPATAKVISYTSSLPLLILKGGYPVALFVKV